MLNHPVSAKKKEDKKQPRCDADRWSIWGSDSVLGNLNTEFSLGLSCFWQTRVRVLVLGFTKVRVELSLFTFDRQVQLIISNCPQLVNSFKHIKLCSHRILIYRYIGCHMDYIHTLEVHPRGHMLSCIFAHLSGEFPPPPRQ